MSASTILPLKPSSPNPQCKLSDFVCIEFTDLNKAMLVCCATSNSRSLISMTRFVQWVSALSIILYKLELSIGISEV